tara:strand:- start:37 stop:183 length:147 start_codon:yes stop_codon:yes gene_type:complete
MNKTFTNNNHIQYLIAIALECFPKDFWPENPIIEEKLKNIKAAQSNKN